MSESRLAATSASRAATSASSIQRHGVALEECFRLGEGGVSGRERGIEGGRVTEGVWMKRSGCGMGVGRRERGFRV